MSALTDAIGAVCQLLSGEATAQAVAAELGDVVEEQEEALEVRPRDAHFDDAYVVHEGDGTVTHVELGLREPVPLAELGDVFGDYREAPRLQYNRPREVLFAVPAGALIASVDDEDRVVGVTVRRD